jgi:hypothetical protein
MCGFSSVGGCYYSRSISTVTVGDGVYCCLIVAGDYSDVFGVSSD